VRLAALLLDEPAACEDAVQEACIRAAAATRRLRNPDASLAYLQRTVVNLSRSAMRRRLVATRYLSRDLPESTASDRVAELARS
jgi:DNA-directed RNA polymerase specialized sigma24 family protein